MNIALTNFSDELFYESRLRLNASAHSFGIPNLFSYSREEIVNTPFYSENSGILSQHRGSGYWLWKPYIILESLKKLNEGDILIYADAGIEIIASLNPLIEICHRQESILLFGNGNLINAEWTKRDCFILMGCDTKSCYQARQCDGAFSLYKKSDFTMEFVQRWLEFGKDPRMFTDNPNTLGKKNSWRFIEHRHDQSVLSIMAFQEKLNYYRMPSQYGNHYKSPLYRINGEYNCVNQKRLNPVNYYSSKPYLNSPYFQLLDQHRFKKNEEPGKSRSLIEKIESRVRKWL